MKTAANTKIAFLGIGLMGSRMVTRLLDANFQVAVWNRTASACDALITHGAQPLSLTDIGDYPVICMCLSDDAAVQSVYAQIEQQLKPQQIIVDFSSLSVAATVALAAQADSKQVQWIDAPVSGGVQGAQSGQLVVFAGGDRHAITALTPIFQTLAQRVTQMGAVGTGQATKICNQLIVAANSTLIAEAVALAHAAGVDTTRLAPALADGFADSKPLQILAPRMANFSFEPVQWKVKTLAKDLGNASTLAKQFNVEIPVAQHALNELQAHADQDYADTDLSTFILHRQPNTSS